MENEIYIGIGGLLLSALTYFAGVKRGNTQINRHEENQRIADVLKRYIDMVISNYSSGFHGLIQAGVNTLKNNSEIRKLIELIESHGDKNPLGSKKDILLNIDLKAFFDYICKNDINLSNTSVEKVIESIKEG